MFQQYMFEISYHQIYQASIYFKHTSESILKHILGLMFKTYLKHRYFFCVGCVKNYIQQNNKYALEGRFLGPYLAAIVDRISDEKLSLMQ